MGWGLGEKMRAMLISSILFLALYGAVLGSTHSLWQTLSSAVKLPLLFLATLIVCSPTLYFFNVLFGSNQSLTQNVALILTAITVTAVLLLSFAPIVVFFLLTTSNYQFFKLLNVVIFAICGIVGVIFLSQGMKIVSAAGKEGASGPALGDVAVGHRLRLCGQPDGLDAAALYRRAQHGVRAVPPTGRQLLHQHLCQHRRDPRLLCGAIGGGPCRIRHLETNAPPQTRSSTCCWTPWSSGRKAPARPESTPARGAPAEPRRAEPPVHRPAGAAA